MELPEPGKKVLVWDKVEKMWRIMKIEVIHEGQFWLSDSKLFFGIDTARFPQWVNLPEEPK